MKKRASILQKAFGFLFIALCPFAITDSIQAEPEKVLKVATVDNYQPCSDLVDNRYLGLSVELWNLSLSS